MERQKFDNALASPKDQMVQSVQVVGVLFLLTVSLNLNSAASKSVIFSPSSEAQYVSALWCRRRGLWSAFFQWFYSYSFTEQPQGFFFPALVSALNTTSLGKSKKLPVTFEHAGKDRFLYIRPSRWSDISKCSAMLEETCKIILVEAQYALLLGKKKSFFLRTAVDICNTAPLRGAHWICIRLWNLTFTCICPFSPPMLSWKHLVCRFSRCFHVDPSLAWFSHLAMHLTRRVQVSDRQIQVRTFIRPWN